jgi:hypothetical protein
MAGRRHWCGGDEIAWQGTLQFFYVNGTFKVSYIMRVTRNLTRKSDVSVRKNLVL